MPLLPDSRAVHVNRPLTTVSVAYQQQQRWIADQVFPTVPVQSQGDLYWKYNKGDWYRTLADVRAPATETPGGGWNVTTDSYYAAVYGIHKDLDDQTRANADNAFNLEADATRWVTQQLLLKRDELWITEFFGDSIWTGSSTGGDLTGVTGTPGAGEFKRWDASGSTPIEDITGEALAMQEKTGYRPNVLVLGPYVYRALLDNTEIIERIKYSQPGIVGTDLLATLFEVDRIVVATSIHNTANTGATDSMSFMAGKSALLCYSTPRPSLMEATAGYIFAWTGLLGAGAYGTRITRWREERIKSNRIEGEMAFDMKVVAPDLGIWWKTAVS